MTGKPIDLRKGLPSGPDDDPGQTTVPVTDPTVEVTPPGPAAEADLGGADRAGPAGSPDLIDTEDGTGSAETGETAPDAGSDTAVVRQGVAKDRLLSLFRKPSRVRDTPGTPGPEAAPDLGSGNVEPAQAGDPVPVRDPEMEAFLIGGGRPEAPEPPVGETAVQDEGAGLLPAVPGPAPQTGLRTRLGGLFRKGRTDPDPEPKVGPEEARLAPEPEGAPASAEEGQVGNPDEDGLTSGGRRPGLLGRLIRKDRTPPAASADETGETAISPDPVPVSPEGSEGGQGADMSEPRPEATAPAGGLFARLRKPVPPAPVPVPPIAEGGVPIRAESPQASAPRRLRRARPKRGFPPIQVLIGWVGESSRKDVLEHVRGFARDHMETLDTGWVAMAEFRGGTLFEVHEGGSGQAYLPELIEELGRDPEQVLWVPSGTKLNRVVTLSIVEGRPFSMMLNEAESARVRASGQVPVERTGRMRRLSARGTPVLVAGATLFAIALGALSASAYLAASIDQQPLPALPYNADALPHGQIVSLSTALREDRWVSRIVFENGAWRAEFETFDELVLPEETEEAQRLIEEAVERDAILQRERERKIEELRSE